MFLNWIVTFGSLVIFLITVGNCERPKTPSEISKVYQEGQTVLSNWIILHDYIGMEIIRRNIEPHYPKDDFFFIGHRLAYIGLEMTVRRQLIGSTSGIIRLVPFSSGYINIVRNNYREYSLARDSENYPTEQELENYKKLLQSFGLDPKSIIERYRNSDNRTVIVKDIGNGLFSFLDILCNWAKLEGISPDQLRDMVKVIGVTFDDDEFPDASVITINEFSFDLVRLEFSSRVTLTTISRISYPERNTGYPRLIPDYPHQLWNEPPPEFDLEHERRRFVYMDRLAEAMHEMSEDLPLTSSNTGSSNSQSGLDQVCQPRESRSKRDLSSPDLVRKQIHLILTSNDDVLETLIAEHNKSPQRSTSPVSFIKDQLENSSSTVSKVLIEICDEYHYSINYGAQASELVHFSSDKTLISGCVKRHWLFHCGEAYESSGIVKTVANLAVQKFSGRIKTKYNVGKAVENLIHNLVSPYPKFPVDYVVEAAKEAVLYCSDEKVLPTMECPSYYNQYIGQMIFAWFAQPFDESNNSLD